jgi:saccharopine dehydrogenase (NAD+, L-lysine-forming)
VYKQKDFKELMHSYFGLKLPSVKVVVTGSGRVAHGILEVMNLMQIHEVEPDEYLKKTFTYPVYTQLKGADLYRNMATGRYSRDEFHGNPALYECLFKQYTSVTDILMNGIYWEESMPRLFDSTDVQHPSFKIATIADVTDDAFGSVPINLGDQTIEDPIYGVDRRTLQKTAPFLSDSIDVMAVGNLPNELPRDASRYFGEQLIKFILEDLLFKEGVDTIERATIVKQGCLTAPYNYMSEYAGL